MKSMQAKICFSVLLLSICSVPATYAQQILFDDATVGKVPTGWQAEGTNQRGPVAIWAVKADANAPSAPNIMALVDAKKGRRPTFNLLWTDNIQFTDGTIELKVKAGKGEIDQGGGPVWRVQDKDNYYIARWNPLEDNFRVYYVKDSIRMQLDSAEIKADPAKWHTIRVEHKGDTIVGYLDGQALLKVTDSTFPEGGGVGLWTKADAVTSFDDFSVVASTGEKVK